MKTDKAKIIQIIKGFRGGMLGNRKAKSMCFMTCYALVGYLHFAGYSCDLVEGLVWNCQHYWIRLPDGCIADPTADQFNQPNGEPMPKIYYGEKPEWYKGV